MDYDLVIQKRDILMKNDRKVFFRKKEWAREAI